MALIQHKCRTEVRNAPVTAERRRIVGQCRLWGLWNCGSDMLGILLTSEVSRPGPPSRLHCIVIHTVYERLGESIELPMEIPPNLAQ